MKLTEIRDAQIIATRIAREGVPASSQRAAQHFADLVVEHGVTTKNRFGDLGVHIPLIDGCYLLVRVESHRKRGSKR